MSDVWLLLRQGLAQVGFVLSALGLWIGALNWTRYGRAFDRSAFRRINRLPSLPALDWLMWSVTHLGSAWSGIGALSLAFLLHRTRFGLISAMALLTEGMVIGVTKVLTQRPRPFLQLAGVRVIGLRPADLSYPSGHSTMAFTVATLLALGLPLSWQLQTLLYLLASLVAYSRLHLGVHYPLDVLAGATLGTGWGLLWVSFLR